VAKKIGLAVLLILTLCLSSSAISATNAGKPQDVNSELIQIADMIKGYEALEHVEALTAGYDGRLAGTTECDDAAQYIAWKFAEYGLKPFGDAGTYFETFPITYWLPSDWSLTVGSTPYDSYPMEWCSSGDITSELVYVGLGTPSEYEGKDVVGKIAFILRGIYTFREKVIWAQSQGAEGAVIFDHTYETLFAGTLTEAYLSETERIPAVSLSRSDGEAILTQMGFSITVDDHLDPWDISGTQSYWPETHLYVNVEIAEDRLTSNVLGVIPGSSKPGEYVLIGAHYDHLGEIRGEVYPGANDNAAGVAVVLELARVLSQYGETHLQRRSIIFAAWTAEEEGLFGSDHFVKTHQKLLPKIKMVLNLDMPGAGEWVNGRQRNIMYVENVAHRYEYGNRPRYTSSGKSWAPKLVYDVAQLLIRSGRIELGVDATPYYEGDGYALYSGIDDVKVVEYIGRSDHEPFLLAGVAATTIFSGADNYPEYHQPGDIYDCVDPAKLEISAMMAGCSAWKIAQLATQPAVAATPSLYPAIGARHTPTIPAGEVA
jgi:aminopeptidase YwaD